MFPGGNGQPHPSVAPGSGLLHAKGPNPLVHIKGARTPAHFTLWVSRGLHETAHTKMLTFHWAPGLDLWSSQGEVHSDWERQRVRAR